MNLLSRIFLTGISMVCVTAFVFAADCTVTVDGSVRQGSVPHFWSRCVGTGGAPLCLREDWRAAAKIGVQEAGFKAFRGHGILNGSNPIRWNGSGSPTYDWTKFDRIYDFLVDTLGTVPVVELSFMPPDLQATRDMGPPKNWNIWRDFIHDVVSHCIERYGKERVRTWLWEVWNEPDFVGFWVGTEDQYFQMYKYAAEGAKSADSLVIIGGPATTNLFENQVTRFLNFCQANNVPVDMITNHCYSDNNLIGGTAPSVDPKIIRDDNRKRVDLIRGFGKKLLSVNSEYTTSYAGPGGKVGANTLSMDSHVNAPFVAKCVKLILDDHTAGTWPAPEVLAYWEISDVFDEGSYIETHDEIPFAQVFGLISYHGIRKASFNGFKMLHMMGTTRLSLTGGTGEADGVDGFATINDDASEVTVMVYNFYKQLGGQTALDTVTLTVNNLPLPRGQVEVYHYRVDSTHSNAYTVWQKQGKPAKPSTSQWDEMRAASNLAELKPMTVVNHTGGPYSETFTLPRQGVSLLLFKGIPAAGTLEFFLPDRTVPRFSVKGTTLRVVGMRKSPVDFYLYSIDGKVLRHISVAGEFCDLRQFLPKGLFLVGEAGNRSKNIWKVAIY